MWRHVQTLRFKLAGLYLLVFGAILTTLTAIILNATQNNLRRDFDGRLQNAVEFVADKIQTARESGSTENLDVVFRYPGFYFESRTKDGKGERRSINLGSFDLPWTPQMEDARTRESPAFQTVPWDASEKLFGNPGEVRIVTLYRDTRSSDSSESQTEPFYVQAAANVRPLRDKIAEQQRLYFMLVPGGLIVAAVASWFLSGRSLRPLQKVRQIAERLTVQDLSQRFEQPRGRDEVALMVETINRMLDRLHDSFLAQERFIAHASHELKTPLSVLLGESQVMIQKARTPEEYERFVASVQEEVRSLAQMVDSVLTLARAEAGLPMTTADEISLNEKIVEAVERCQPQARERQARLVPHLAMPRGDETEPTLIGDGDLIRLMFVNLIRNAIRYTPVDQAVDISVSLTGTFAVVAVRDNGPGIPPEYISKVFDRFVRVPEKDGVFKGVGLGLTIVRGIAQLHGGTADASNRPEGGCEFTVRLPLAKSSTTL
ncbi:MAG: HAMP domain-containing protein [Planctomycetes bacterium]|nr:HAMP domain-containing protein [Planctomycetota bacterium]